MSDLHLIDTNFALPAVETEGMVFRDVLKTEADIYGLYQPRTNPIYCRLPQELADTVSPGVSRLNRCTAGGRLRFKTDSQRIAFRVRQTGEKKASSHQTFINTSGFDMYLWEDGRQRFWCSLIPPPDRTNGYETMTRLPDCRLREFVVNFPAYDGVLELQIGIEEGRRLEGGSRYRSEKPVVFYGSSITQGACASRPGNCYQNILTRRLDFDYLNFGYSGNGKGEPAVAEYLASLDASAYVMDYDHNAPTVDHLAATHEPFVRILREKHPDTPILLMSKTDIPRTEKAEEFTNRRRDVIRATYEKLLREGDRNIYFLDGQTIFAIHGGDSCTVDGTHPTDLGFMCMADAVEPFLRKMLYGGD